VWHDIMVDQIEWFSISCYIYRSTLLLTVSWRRHEAVQEPEQVIYEYPPGSGFLIHRQPCSQFISAGVRNDARTHVLGNLSTSSRSISLINFIFHQTKSKSRAADYLSIFTFDWMYFGRSLNFSHYQQNRDLIEELPPCQQ
jgi:hypothetical protein